MHFGAYAEDAEERVHSQYERYSLTMRVRGCTPARYCPLLDGVASPQTG